MTVDEGACTGVYDAMQVDSGTCLARLACAVEGVGGEVTATLDVIGEVSVRYRGGWYRSPSEFPDDLKALVRETRGACLFDGSVDGQVVGEPEIDEIEPADAGPEGVRADLLDAIERAFPGGRQE